MEKEILEGNKLIAEFMNSYRPYSGRYSGPHSIEDIGMILYTNDDGYYVTDGAIIRVDYSLSQLLYHSSWEWLMPVVEKIENDIPGLDNIGGAQVLIFNDCCKINPYKMDVTFRPFNEIKGNKKEAIWHTVVEFIKWYNEQEKK
jgi:hypothetical protein